MRDIFLRVIETDLNPTIVRYLHFVTYLHTCLRFEFLTAVNINIKACRAVARQRFGRHLPAVTETHAKIVVLLETVFSTRYVQST
jgi:hypothetical protein